MCDFPRYCTSEITQLSPFLTRKLGTWVRISDMRQDMTRVCFNIPSQLTPPTLPGRESSLRCQGQVLLMLRGLLLLLLVLHVMKRCDRRRTIRLHGCWGRRGYEALEQGGGRRSGGGYRSGRGRGLVEVQGVPLLVRGRRPRRVSGVTRAGGRD